MNKGPGWHECTKGPSQLAERFLAWWRHQMETFSALLAICAGNSPVPGEFPAQRPVTRSFDVFFDLRLNKRSSKQSWGWWFETLSCSLWRHRNGVSKYFSLVHKLQPLVCPTPDIADYGIYHKVHPWNQTCIQPSDDITQPSEMYDNYAYVEDEFEWVIPQWCNDFRCSMEFQNKASVQSTFLKLISLWTKWPPFSRWYFQMRFREWEIWYFD